MAADRPPMRFLRVLLITLLLAAAIVMLVPEEPQPVMPASEGKALAVSDVSPQ